MFLFTKWRKCLKEVKGVFSAKRCTQLMMIWSCKILHNMTPTNIQKTNANSVVFEVKVPIFQTLKIYSSSSIELKFCIQIDPGRT